MATSAQFFGNMFSMAGASSFCRFCRCFPSRFLFMNILTDIPEMTIARQVDDENDRRPRCWDIRFIRNFMLLFGVLSSLFDNLAFGVLRLFSAPAKRNSGPAGSSNRWFPRPDRLVVRSPDAACSAGRPGRTPLVEHCWPSSPAHSCSP